MPRIVFWNVNNKDLTRFVCDIAKRVAADIIVLNENVVGSADTVQALRQNVSKKFYVPIPAVEDRFHCFCRDKRFDMAEVHAGFRTSVRNLKIGSCRALLGLIHGVDPRNYDTEARIAHAISLGTELRFVKQQQETNRLIVLGDFNMNPFDRGMNLAEGMNSMMTKRCAAAGSRRYLNHEYDLYYNPMWSLFGDETAGPPGTIFDTSSQGPYGWSMFDQVVLNHSIVHLFEKVEILTNADQDSLIDKNGRPDSKNASNHLPILVTLREVEP